MRSVSTKLLHRLRQTRVGVRWTDALEVLTLISKSPSNILRSHDIRLQNQLNRGKIM